MSAEPTSPPATTPRSPHRMTTRQRLLFFLTAWLIVLMPFLFWWNTWFGRSLSDRQLDSYLHDDKKPRHIQHALVQIGERMAHGDPNLARWYPDLVRLSTYPVEEVRSTDAWVMGQDNSDRNFHAALVTMLKDSSLVVRGNAALSLVRFGDASGRSQLISLLQPAQVTAPQSGTVVDAAKPGAAVHANGLLAKLKVNGSQVEIRSPISGRIRSVAGGTGGSVKAADVIATIDPETEQVWEALRGLYLIGQPEDLPAVTAYERETPDLPERVRQQAELTEKAIRERSK